MNCLVYLPHSYTGSGPAGSCVEIIRHFKDQGLQTKLFLGREKKAVPSSVDVWRALPRALNWLPWHLASRIAFARLDVAFRKALQTNEPGIAYFWPTPDQDLVELAKKLGWVTVREMTNRTMQAAKRSLDEAFQIAGETRPHHITQSRVDAELDLVQRFDFVFSSNEDVDRSLLEAGVSDTKILRTSFGWTEDRFCGDARVNSPSDRFVVGYIGMISIGKGVLDLLQAWKSRQGQGRLKLAGPIDWSMAEAVERAAKSDPSIEVVGYVGDVEAFYTSCDVIVIPTLDEGGPQVTYEAAAAGVPIIATHMARARFLENGRNALVIPVHDPVALGKSIESLAHDPGLRRMLGDQAKKDVMRFSYKSVGSERARLLIEALEAPIAASMKSS